MKGSTFSIMIAIAKNGVIGKDNDLPWPSLRTDMRHFMATTKGKPVMAARKTHESILARSKGKPLVGRHTMVLTRNQEYTTDPKCIVFQDQAKLLEYADSLNDEVFVIGGAELYHMMLPVADKAYVTIVDAEPEGDAFFPLESFSRENGWKEVSRTHFEADEENTYPGDIVIYERLSPYVYIPNARTFDQRMIMRQIRADGVCPFCRENLERYHTQPILAEGRYWVISPSQYPRKGASRYLMAFYKASHIMHLHELPGEAMVELLDHAQRLGIGASGGLAIRFGEPKDTGGSVHHLHAHLIFPDPNQDPVRFKIGPNM
ncbi:MAG TPA: dihydrofolate reductase [Verrucomicrobiae bacterium]|nr:dihydrofolate reductase [Verrucomicrobiae bacterium]